MTQEDPHERAQASDQEGIKGGRTNSTDTKDAPSDLLGCLATPFLVILSPLPIMLYVAVFYHVIPVGLGVGVFFVFKWVGLPTIGFCLGLVIWGVLFLWIIPKRFPTPRNGRWGPPPRR